MATVTIPDNLLTSKEFINAFIEAFHEGRFLPNYWINYLPNGTLENIKFTQDCNLVKATCYISYKTHEEAMDAAKKILTYIQSPDRSIITYIGKERNLVYYTYNFHKL